MPRKLDYLPVGLEEDEAAELLECRKCGNSDKVSGHSITNSKFRVFCWGCGATTPWYDDFLTAMRKWNLVSKRKKVK